MFFDFLYQQGRNSHGPSQRFHIHVNFNSKLNVTARKKNNTH